MTAEKLRYVVDRLRGLPRPPVTVLPAPEAEVVFERDVAVTVRDGTVLRVNVFRPRGGGAHPALLCAHPYGKDNLPKPRRGGGFKVAMRYRLLRMPEPLSFSAWTSWEAPDPAHWVPRGYAVVNCDLRGCGTSDGVGDLLSPAESADYHDLIEWATAQPWCSGKVGLNGVSYLALSQYGAAATRPPSLAAICPWEGFTDPYRDLLFPGGVREDGFVKTWAKGLKGDRLTYDLRAEQLRRRLRDAVWAGRAPDLAKVRVPMLVCGSFSDNNLHSRGSIRAFEQVGSEQRWLYTHRGGKWCLAAGGRAMDRALPRRRLAARGGGAGGRRGGVRDRRRAGELDLARAGRPRAVRADGAAPAGLARRRRGRQPLRRSREVARRALRPLRGSYGFGLDRVTTGWAKLSHREPDPELSRPFAPVNRDDAPRPPAPGEVAEIELALGPSATFFRAGEEVRLALGGRWPNSRNPITGQFLAAYEASPDCTVRLHCGGDPAPRLLVPAIGS